MNFKNKRVQNKELLRTYHSKKCIICRSKAEPAHIRSRGAGGPDESFNLMPLCRRHHSEQHNLGWISFLKLYPTVEFYLVNEGWEIGLDYIFHEEL